MIPGNERDFFTFERARPALGPTQPPITWCRGLFTRG